MWQGATRRRRRVDLSEIQRCCCPACARFDVIGELQAVKIGKTAAIDIVPRMLAIKDALEGKYHIVRIQFAGGREPRLSFETEHRDVNGSGRLRRYPILPSFQPVLAPDDKYRIDIKQSVIQLGR